MITSKIFLRLVVLMGLGLSVNSSLLQAMNDDYGSVRDGDTPLITVSLDDESDDDEQEISCLEDAMRWVSLTDRPINIKQSDRLLASRYAKLMDGIKKFNNLTSAEKTELLEKTLEIAYALRYGKFSEHLDRTEVVITLCKQSLKDLIAIEQKSGTLKDSKFLEHFMVICNEASQDKKTADAMIFMSKQKYLGLGDKDEMSYLGKLEDMLEAEPLGDAPVKALIVECLNQCDDNITELAAETFSIVDLKSRWWQVCEHDQTRCQRLLMALSGAEDPSFYEIVQGFGRLGISAGKVFAIAFCVAGFIQLVIVFSTRSDLPWHVFTVPLVIASVLAAVTILGRVGQNCGHYCMTKQL